MLHEKMDVNSPLSSPSFDVKCSRFRMSSASFASKSTGAEGGLKAQSSQDLLYKGMFHYGLSRIVAYG